MPEPLLDFVRACQRRVPCHLGGGAALSGAYLAHRLTGDLDLFVHEAGAMRELARQLPEAAAEQDGRLRLERDSGHLVRAEVAFGEVRSTVDLVHEPVPDVAPAPPPVEGVVVESLSDLRANKITCLLSRAEPRDLVDLLFLDRAGYPPEADLALALRKDAGIDPATLAWLLADFPLEPLPPLLKALGQGELGGFRDALAERFRRAALGQG